MKKKLLYMLILINIIVGTVSVNAYAGVDIPDDFIFSDSIFFLKESDWGLANAYGISLFEGESYKLEMAPNSCCRIEDLTFTTDSEYVSVANGVIKVASSIPSSLDDVTVTASYGGTSTSVTVVIDWENKHIYHFDANGGVGTMKDMAIKYEDTNKAPNCTFTRPGYHFVGWGFKMLINGKYEIHSYSPGCIGWDSSLGDKGVETVYAMWEPNTTTQSPTNTPTPINSSSTYKVSYNANGGKGTMGKVTYKIGSTYSLSKNKYKRTGYTFTGWNTNKNGKGIAYKNNASVKNIAKKGETITLYAQWKPITYNVKFNANGGKGSIKTLKMTYDKKTKLTKNKFTKKGYKFAGWATSKKNANKGIVKYKNAASVKNLSPTKNKTITLYAVWKK